MIKDRLTKKWPELPSCYVEFMENYPSLLIEMGDLCDCEFLNKFEDIEKLNEEIELIDSIDISTYFAIGHSGCGDYYLIEIDNEDPTIVLWNHEIEELSSEEVYYSIEEFAGEMIENHKSAEEFRKKYEAALELAEKKKPWWKIF